jgi:hypothetical protein
VKNQKHLSETLSVRSVKTIENQTTAIKNHQMTKITIRKKRLIQRMVTIKEAGITTAVTKTTEMIVTIAIVNQEKRRSTSTISMTLYWLKAA